MDWIRTLAAPAAAAGAVILVSGCGGGEESQAEGPGTTVPADEPIEVVGTDFDFDPQTLVVENATAPLEIVLDNQGAVPHNLTVFEGESEVGATATIEGGATDAATVDIEPGTYRMVCTVGDHEDLGMVGDLEVRSKRP